MPDRKMHNNFSKTLLGESGNDIHKFLDAPIKQLGRNHRDSRHDLRTVSLLYATNGKNAAEHALAHIVLDRLVSSKNTKATKLVNAGMQNTLKEIKKIKGLI